MKEQWRSVIGYEGIYEVSDFGRIRSLDREDAAGKKRKGKVISIATCDRYPFVNLCRNRERKVTRVHAIVAEAFLGPKPPGCEINHIDGDRANNRANNLEYVTHQENMLHARRAALFGKLTLPQIQEVREIFNRDPRQRIAPIAEQYGVSRPVIQHLLSCKTHALVPNQDGNLPAPVQRALTVEDITSLQAQGYTLPEIGRHYGVEYSTPYQVLRRAKLRAQNRRKAAIEA